MENLYIILSSIRLYYECISNFPAHETSATPKLKGNVAPRKSLAEGKEKAILWANISCPAAP